jgi:putative acetyltransferase
MIEIISAQIEHRETVRDLFRQYEASLGFSLCFQGFEQELRDLPGSYAPPPGALLLGMMGGKASGCVAMRRLDDGVCEMKRLFVLPQARGTGLGRQLCARIVQEGRRAGHHAMRLDTVESMNAAIRLYESMGFLRIEPYCVNPMQGALFFELRL